MGNVHVRLDGFEFVRKIISWIVVWQSRVDGVIVQDSSDEDDDGGWKLTFFLLMPIGASRGWDIMKEEIMYGKVGSHLVCLVVG